MWISSTENPVNVTASLTPNRNDIRGLLIDPARFDVLLPGNYCDDAVRGYQATDLRGPCIESGLGITSRLEIRRRLNAANHTTDEIGALALKTPGSQRGAKTRINA